MRQPGQLSEPLADEAATRRAGAALAGALIRSGVDDALVTLAGELGAGKTTFVRGLLEALGVTGPVRSPTYTLIETYAVAGRAVHHLDCYRLAGGEELEGLGFRELTGPGHWVLVEWPERVPAVARLADLVVRLDYEATGRRLTLGAASSAGTRVVHELMAGKA